MFALRKNSDYRETLKEGLKAYTWKFSENKFFKKFTLTFISL